LSISISAEKLPLLDVQLQTDHLNYRTEPLKQPAVLTMAAASRRHFRRREQKPRELPKEESSKN